MSASFDPSLAPLLANQSAKYPAPEHCEVVGGWEDGSIVAACQDGRWISHGPDADDDWVTYTGPVAPEWSARAPQVEPPGAQ